jgi:hypothetical protein
MTIAVSLAKGTLMFTFKGRYEMVLPKGSAEIQSYTTIFIYKYTTIFIYK